MRNRVLPEQWAHSLHTDALLAADWPTCDYWNCNLSLAFRWSAQPCSGQIRPQSASDHWPLGANLNEFQLEILKNAVSQAQGNLWYHSDSRRQRQKWQQLQHGGEMQAVNEQYKIYTFNRLTIVKKYEKIWILRRVSLWQRVDDQLKYDKASPFFQQRGFIIWGPIFLSVYWALVWVYWELY